MNPERGESIKWQGFWVGVVLTTPEGFIIEQPYPLEFRAINNEAKYETVIAGIKMTTLRVAELEVRCGSLLIVSQINGEHKIKDDQMAMYLKIVTT